jgi:uncharacterized membrane protein YeaQ/YmgE (transglycosylase-associated protein family)
MGIIGWIILGGIAGWIASIVAGTDARQGIFSNILARISLMSLKEGLSFLILL